MLDIKGLKTSIRRRFEFIEFQLHWEGSVGRKKLQDQFSISPQQATKDLTAYMDAYPDNMFYDPRKKSYLPSLKFRPKLTPGDASEYLMHLDMLHHAYRDKSEIWVSDTPSFDAVSVQSRQISSQTLIAVLTAIDRKSCIHAKYLSLASDNTASRTFLPHAIASDGHRWHMRAFDFNNTRYSDFVLSRIASPEPVDMPSQDVPEDLVWNSDIEVILVPDPILDQAKKERLEYEYSMEQGQLCLTIRQAMLFYYLRHYGFDPLEKEDEIMRNKSSFHLSVANINEVEECLGRRK